MLATSGTFSAIDFETTGVVEGYGNEPWQIGIVRFRDGKVVEDERLDLLLRVGDRPFNPKAPGQHHKLRAEIAKAQTLAEIWPDLSKEWLSVPLVAHNASVERNVLHQAAPMHQCGPWIDTLKLARLAYPQEESHKLEDLTHRLGLVDEVKRLCPGKEAHDALYDAVACGLLLAHLMELPGWNQATVDALTSA